NFQHSAEPKQLWIPDKFEIFSTPGCHSIQLAPFCQRVFDTPHWVIHRRWRKQCVANLAGRIWKYGQLNNKLHFGLSYRQWSKPPGKAYIRPLCVDLDWGPQPNSIPAL